METFSFFLLPIKYFQIRFTIAPIIYKLTWNDLRLKKNDLRNKIKRLYFSLHVTIIKVALIPLFIPHSNFELLKNFRRKTRLIALMAHGFDIMVVASPKSRRKSDGDTQRMNCGFSTGQIFRNVDL